MPKPPSAPEFSCADCPTKDDCKAAFGRYWTAKSRGGIGCGYRFGGWKKENVRRTAW